MKVTILERHNYHYDIIDTLCRIYEDSIEEVYLNKKLINRISNINKLKNINELDEELSLKDSIKLIKKINKSDVDYVIMATNQGYLFFYLLLLLFCNKKIIISIHNINSYFQCTFKLKKIRKFFIKRIILNKCYGINVLGNELKETLRKRNINKVILNLPARLYEEGKNLNEEIDNNKKDLIIGIPGAFDSKRRDYKTLYKAFELIKQNKKEGIKLSFIGGCDCTNKEDRELFEKFKKLGDICYSETNIYGEEFSKRVKESDILLNPSVLDFYYERCIQEIYGETKQSGGIYVQIEFAKPGILPSYVKVDPDLSRSTLSYSNEDELCELILKLSEDKDYRHSLKKEAERVSRKFTLIKVRERIYKELENVKQNGDEL